MNHIPSTVEELEIEQLRIAALQPPAWSPSEAELMTAGCFVAFARGIEGAGSEGDDAWVAAAAVQRGRQVGQHVFHGTAGSLYSPGYLFLRVGELIIEAIAGLAEAPSVVLVDGTGLDHPRGAGLALHVGHLTGIPTVGVTDRPLVAQADSPASTPGSTAPLQLEGRLVGHVLRVRRNAKPLVVHAGWRTSPDVALGIIQRNLRGFRTPEPLRRARQLARKARSFRED